jgi:hypothetical protein
MNDELMVLLSQKDSVGAYRRVRGQVAFTGGKLASSTIRREDVGLWRQRIGSLLSELNDLENEKKESPEP